MNTRSTRIKLGISALALGVGVATITASPLEVNLLGSKYSTYVFVATDVDWSAGVSRTNLSFHPYSDSIYSTFHDPQTPANVGILGADANADLFGVSVRTYCQHNKVFFPEKNSTAIAKSEISFAPLTSGLATLSFDRHVAQEWFYSEGSVSLFDVTANQTLWDYSWTFSQFIPGADRSFNEDGSEDWTCLLETNFDATHTYALSMREQSWADSDNQQIALQLSGLTVVPEPSAFALTGLAAIGLLSSRRRRQ